MGTNDLIAVRLRNLRDFADAVRPRPNNGLRRTAFGAAAEATR